MHAVRKIHSAAVVVATLFAAAVMYSQVRSQMDAPTTAIIRQVEVGDRAGATTVRVSGEGTLTVHVAHLTGPDRLVLDFANSHLRGVQSAIPEAAAPVRGIRAGQFKPDVARVVVDLEGAVRYQIEPGAGSVTIVFEAANSSSAQAPPVQSPRAAGAPPPKVAALPLFKTNTARMIPVSAMPGTPPAIAASSAAVPVTTALPARVGPAALPVPVTLSAELGMATQEAAGGSPNSFQNGLLTFRAKDRPLQAVLDDIGSIANVAIMVAQGVGSEHVSAEFRGYRLDEALRQILMDYDVLFSYGSGGDSQGNPALRTVWVYAPNQGPGIGRFAMAAWRKSGQEYQRLLTNIDNPDQRARAVDELIRRDGRDAANVLMEALKDPSEKVRYQALYRAVLVGALPPEDTIIDLVLNDSSEQVRAWAFQMLPLDPTLQWVAQRAADDSNQQIAELARNYLKDLDTPSGTEASDASEVSDTQQLSPPRQPAARPGP